MSEPATIPCLLHFGVFEVYLQSGELHKNGQKVKLSVQPFEVLAMLLARPGQLVSLSGAVTSAKLGEVTNPSRNIAEPWPGRGSSFGSGRGPENLSPTGPSTKKTRKSASWCH